MNTRFKKILTATLIALGLTAYVTTASAFSPMGISDFNDAILNLANSEKNLQAEIKLISLNYLSSKQQAQQQAMITNEILGMPNVDEVTVTTIHAFKKA
jgi:hypothetical protein